MTTKIMQVKTAGFGDPEELLYDIQADQSCGKIKDGVSFAHGRKNNPAPGWWLIEFKDLEKIYLEAREARKSI